MGSPRASVHVQLWLRFDVTLSLPRRADSCFYARTNARCASTHVRRPLEAPAKYEYPPPASSNNNTFGPRMIYNAMARALDDGMKNVTDAIKAAGLWPETLVVFSADNGGWLLPAGRAGSSNWPLRGGKVSDFEGGVRAVSFISGGYLPASVRGSRHTGIISVADWYATFCRLAGVDPTDAPANRTVPGIDSIDIWASLLVPNNTQSPRTTLPLAFNGVPTGPQSQLGDAGLIVGEHKIICGKQAGMGWWQG